MFTPLRGLRRLFWPPCRPLRRLPRAAPRIAVAWVAALSIAVAWLAPRGVAWADDPLAVARKAVAESDYVAARPALIAALDAGGRGRDDLLEIYRLTGIVEAALGDVRAATEAFTHLLALSPTAALPAGTSPKITRPFDAAAQYVASHGALDVKAELRAGAPVVMLVVASDPLNMVATARVVSTVDGGPERSADIAVASERTDIALSAGQRIRARVAALDVHGNRLVEIAVVREPVTAQVQAPARTARVVRAEPRPVYLRWWPYAAAGVAVLGAAGYFGLAARSETDDLQRIIADSAHHTYGDARAVEDRARRDVLFANIGFGVAGALAITAGVLYLTAPGDRVETLSVAPAPGGGQLVLGGTF
jgi:predicted RNA-binding Zn ribbon-like protein